MTFGKLSSTAASCASKNLRHKTPSPSVNRTSTSYYAPALVTSPVYYIAKGMWKKGLALLLACVLVVIVLSIALEYFGLGKIANALGYGVSAVFAMRANIDYYKKMVLGENGWW